MHLDGRQEGREASRLLLLQRNQQNQQKYTQQRCTRLKTNYHLKPFWVSPTLWGHWPVKISLEIGSFPDFIHRDNSLLPLLDNFNQIMYQFFWVRCELFASFVSILSFISHRFRLGIEKGATEPLGQKWGLFWFLTEFRNGMYLMILWCHMTVIWGTKMINKPWRRRIRRINNSPLRKHTFS